MFQCYKNNTVFDAQNVGNRISELLDFKFFWGGGSTPPKPPRKKRPCGPFSSHSCLLHLQWLLVTKVLKPLESCTATKLKYILHLLILDIYHISLGSQTHISLQL